MDKAKNEPSTEGDFKYGAEKKSNKSTKTRLKSEACTLATKQFASKCTGKRANNNAPGWEATNTYSCAK